MDGSTLLHVIAKEIANECLDLLLETMEKNKKIDIVAAENSVGLTPIDYARTHMISKVKVDFSYYVKEKEDKVEKDVQKFYKKLCEYAQKHKLKRLATDPGKVRETIELAIKHSNESVVKARLKAEQRKLLWRPYRDYSGSEDESDDEHDITITDHHAPNTITLKYTEYDAVGEEGPL